MPISISKIDLSVVMSKIDPSIVFPLFRECTPKILVYTDALSYAPDQDFGLTVFVNTLRSSTIHGMTPIVMTASRGADPLADKASYRFDDAIEGVLISRYDVVFMLCIASGNPTLPVGERNALAKFMQAGGGVFATGDHSTLGAADCGDVMRIRSMRRWDNPDNPPDMGDETRHSTNRSGQDETEEFDDQEDDVPQILYPNYRTDTGGIGVAHPLLQMVAPRKVLEVFPDHPHEGECVIPGPAALAQTYPVDGLAAPEWPNDGAGNQVVPQAVAFTVSYGDGFPGKDPLTPKLFAAIVAYDGQRAGVGRAVTDATWHHFVNVNLDGGFGDAGAGALRPGGVDSEALIRIRRYYVNLATWLMPKKVRKCRRWPIFAAELVRFPLFEEVVANFPPIPQPDPGPLAASIGGILVTSLSRQFPPFVVEELVADAVEDAMGEKGVAALREGCPPRAGLRSDGLALAALGGALVGMLEVVARGETIAPHGALDEAAIAGARHATGDALARARSEATHRVRLLEALCEGDHRAR